jgi:hypothetical protein
MVAAYSKARLATQRAPHARDRRHARIRAEPNARTWAFSLVSRKQTWENMGFPANIGVCVFVSIMSPPNLDFVFDSFDEFDVFVSVNCLGLSIYHLLIKG